MTKKQPTKLMKPAPPLGELEGEVMGIVWGIGRVTVKDVAARLSRARAYNTVQTTLERLHRKALVIREKESHSFVYSARVGRAEYHRQLIANLVGELLPNEREPVLAAFVETAADADLENLERLERLIRAKRKAERGEP